MQTFELDQQLQSDTLFLGEFDLSIVLLMNNALVPWFILVPQVSARELYQLDVDKQHTLQNEMNVIAKFLHHDMHADKINIGIIGNIVPQLHVHIVGRFKSDYAWPHTVWGRDEKEIYDPLQYENLTRQFNAYLHKIVD